MKVLQNSVGLWEFHIVLYSIAFHCFVLYSIALYCMTGVATISKCYRTPWCSGSVGHCIVFHCIVLCSIALHCVVLQGQRRYEGAAELRSARGVLDIVLNSIVLNSIVFFCISGVATICRCCRMSWGSGSVGHCIPSVLYSIVLYCIV